MDDEYKEATTSAVAQLIAAKQLLPDALNPLLKNDALIASGVALIEITRIIQKMMKEGELQHKQVVKILNEASLVEKFALILYSLFILLSLFKPHQLLPCTSSYPRSLP